MSRLLEGKVALVTGAGHGIGRGHALELARHGAKVVVNDLGGSVSGTGSGRDADDVVALIHDAGGEATADYGDVSSEPNVESMISRAVETFGDINIVVNNAGIVRDGVVWKMTSEDFDKVLAVHLRGTWLTSHHAARYWREQSKAGAPLSARIINTTSGAGLVGNFGQSNYAAAKAAIAALTLTLSLELARIGVTVNCIGPAANTRITASVAEWEVKIREAEEIGRDEFDPMDPAASSPLVAWLASDEASYVNGQILRAIGDKIYRMQPWTEAASVSNGGKRWDANELGRVLGTKLFQVQAPGLTIG
jgi:NAD(P)-dependent dehydrogenase (short-subunit alcohol dehydrogenase family)